MLEQNHLMAIQTIVFIITAIFIWWQIRSASRSSTVQNFRAIHEILSTDNIRELRRELYQYHRAILKQTTILEQEVILKQRALEKNRTTVSQKTIEKKRLQELIKDQVDYIDKNKELVDQLVVAFDAMGVMVNLGGATKTIMIHMYWDVVIKSWDCLENYVWKERSAKAPIGNNLECEVGNPVPRTQCDMCEIGKYRWKRCRRFYEWIRWKLGRNIRWCLYRILVWEPEKYGYFFKIEDFCPAACYPQSHYENFEFLMRHCEWFGWTRGISRPKLHSQVISDVSSAMKTPPIKFCPVCGGKVKIELRQGSIEYVCTCCGKTHYENSKPCVVAVIERDCKVLLNKRLIEPGSGKWDFVGGFLEKGEPPEEGLRREVKEELGVVISTCEMMGIYMDVYGEEEDATLNIAYLCHILGEPMVKTDEFDEIQWFPLDELPNEYSFHSVKPILEDLSQRKKIAIKRSSSCDSPT